MEAFLKTFVMMVGELDYETLFYNTPDRLIFYPTLTYILFILFMLVMSIILMNLLLSRNLTIFPLIFESRRVHQALISSLNSLVESTRRIKHSLPSPT
jgi:hypothetical protein